MRASEIVIGQTYILWGRYPSSASKASWQFAKVMSKELFAHTTRTSGRKRVDTIFNVQLYDTFSSYTIQYALQAGKTIDYDPRRVEIPFNPERTAKCSPRHFSERAYEQHFQMCLEDRRKEYAQVIADIENRKIAEDFAKKMKLLGIQAEPSGTSCVIPQSGMETILALIPPMTFELLRAGKPHDKR